MYRIKYSFITVLTLVFALVISCKDLDEMNINPNGVVPEDADPNLMIPTIIVNLSKSVVNLGYGDIGGAMQHTQYDGWSGGHNDYSWDAPGRSWGVYYNILRDNDVLYEKAVEQELDFHKGVALIMEASCFGLITDLWGDAPYSAALNAEEGGEENYKPAFDDQRDIYLGILAALDTANMLLSGEQNSYLGIVPSQDVIYGGDVSKWRKFANSLALRYYMRLSLKDPGIAEAGIKNITDNPDDYPLITDAADDATVGYIGASPEDSWPNNTVFDKSTSGGYLRTKMCATLVDTMKYLNDPRLGVWANKVEIPLVLEPDWPDDRDEIIDGKRHIAQNVADEYEATWGTKLDYDSTYIGIPPQLPAASQYNLNPNLDQGQYNPHCSQLNDIYKESSGPLLLARLMSAAEVNFILAEAALAGWVSGPSKDYYDAGIKASFDAWGVSGDFDEYIAGTATFNNTQDQIILQKWIASWTAATEAWFDYRRTGYPDLKTGETASVPALPLRFGYSIGEIRLNEVNTQAAIEKLETTSYSPGNEKNSYWSKTWLLQDTGKPY